jgi:hypothetical protein
MFEVMDESLTAPVGAYAERESIQKYFSPSGERHKKLTTNQHILTAAICCIIHYRLYAVEGRITLDEPLNAGARGEKKQFDALEMTLYTDHLMTQQICFFHST